MPLSSGKRQRGIAFVLIILINNTRIDGASGFKLSPDQKLVAGSVLDELSNAPAQPKQLFKGHSTLRRLSLWSFDGTFTDHLTIAKGYQQFAAQWYWLSAGFNRIHIQDYSKMSAGNWIFSTGPADGLSIPLSAYLSSKT
ncbi:hypothetical protein GGR53DRAFT_465131 [Hypoxylon sp. FL1150]|nr:hypothetical protein GGR53DRAFT_465131 [Hypoxylon sp. FL1150]